MNKVVELLEAHVQWLVLGIAVVFLAWVTYAYVLSSPILVTDVGPGPLPPGQVDKEIEEKELPLLEKKINTEGTVEFPPISIVPGFSNLIANTGARNIAWDRVFPMTTVDLGPEPKGPEDRNNPEQTLVAKNIRVAPAVITNIRHGRSSVLTLDAAGQPVGTPVDKNWVTVRFDLSATDLLKAMEAEKIPAWTRNTVFLRVKLLRQEQTAAGWTPPIEIAPLTGGKLAGMPMPFAGQRLDEEGYQSWANANQPEIVQPPFYTVAKGDIWSVPGYDLPGMVAGEPAPPELAPLDPSQRYTDAEKLKHTMAERQQYERDRRKYLEEQRKGAGGGRPGGTGGGAGGGGRNPDGLFVPMSFSFAPGDGLPPAGNPDNPDAPSDGGNPGTPLNPAIPAGMFPVPPGQFNPAAPPEKYVGWAHDDTVIPGKVYRYTVVYLIQNPIFKTANVALPQSLAEIFSLESEPSAPSADVEIPSTQRFFMAGNPFSPTSAVRIEIFSWVAGVWNRKVFDVYPGDMIGAFDAVSKVDYTTGYTLADVRPKFAEQGVHTILVMSPDGKVIPHDHVSDLANAERKKLDKAVKDAATPPPGTPGAPGPGGAPGTPPPVGL